MRTRRLLILLILIGLGLPLGCDSNKPASDAGPGLPPGQKFESVRKKSAN